MPQVVRWRRMSRPAVIACMRPRKRDPVEVSSAMSAPVVVQVSDTHLSPPSQEFNGNWTAALEAINALNPDLVVHTGDLNSHDPDSDDDQDFAKAQMNRLTVPWIATPGNHDVGDG